MVTGGARGIGFETAKAMVSRGASVVIVDLDADAAEQAAARLHDTRAGGLAADVTDRGALQQAVAATVGRFGGLDVVVANAGIVARAATFRATASEGFDRVIDVNLMGVARTVEVALPEVLRRRGHLVLISSVYAFSNGAGATAYAMSKAGVEQLGRALRVELVPHGVGVTVAYFGFIDTEMVHHAIDRDAVVGSMLATFPRALQKRLTPAAAGTAIAVGVERRAARVIRPRVWVAMSALRGLLNPLIDIRLQRDATVQAAVLELDSRERENQPTSA